MPSLRIPRLIALAVLAVAVLAITGRPTAAQSELVIVREGAKGSDAVYHRPGCPAIKDGKGVLAMTRAEAEARGFKQHHDCDPAFAKTPASPAAAGAPAPVEKVFVDAGGKYYHRKGCPRLGTDVKEVAVTAVGKRWPCPDCKPPVPKRSSDPLVPRWRG